MCAQAALSPGSGGDRRRNKKGPGWEGGWYSLRGPQTARATLIHLPRPGLSPVQTTRCLTRLRTHGLWCSFGHCDEDEASCSHRSSAQAAEAVSVALLHGAVWSVSVHFEGDVGAPEEKACQGGGAPWLSLPQEGRHADT